MFFSFSKREKLVFLIIHFRPAFWKLCLRRWRMAWTLFLSTGDFLTRSSAPRPGLHLKNSWKLPSSSWGKAAGRSLQGRSCPHIGDSFGASCYGRASSWVDSCWAMWAGADGRGGHPVSPWGLVAQPERLQLPSGCPFLCSFPRL